MLYKKIWIACAAVVGALGAILVACGGGSGASSGTTAPGVTVGAGPVVQVWLTSADQSSLLARQADTNFGAASVAADNIDVDATVRYQEMVGFGAALTDASAWLIQNRMNSTQRAALLQDLFGRDTGLGLSFTRLTIGASDFSRSQYTLDDRPAGQSDPALANFSIDPMRAEVLPVLKSALSLNPALKIMASPWSAPAWMKANGSLVGSTNPTVPGRLLPSAYDPFARYLAKFADAMEAEGLPLFALTAQNEPGYEPLDYPGMLIDPGARATFVGQFLGPVLAARAHPVKLLDWDHNWDLPSSPLTLLNDALARPFVSGVAWHCYAGDVSAQTQVHNAYPDKETYFTECSGGNWAPVWRDDLLWFVRTLVIGSTRNWAKGVLLWNLALDENHGPHTGGCGDCRGVVTIDSTTGAVTRNVEYYALGHASKFVREAAQRIASGTGVDGLDSVAFRNADDGSLVLIVANAASTARRFTVRQGGQTFGAQLDAGSVASYVWTPKV